MELREYYSKGLEEAKLFLQSIIDEFGEDLQISGSSTNPTFFSSLNLHPKIVTISEQLFVDGHYPQAIFESLKILEQEIKLKSTQTSLIGKKLASTVFNVNSPILRLNSLNSQEEKNEQEGFMHIFMGTFQGIKDPNSHAIVNITEPELAIEYLALISMLMRKLDNSTA